MFPQRPIARAAVRFAAQARAQAQRRLASTGSETENSFVRERRAVKEHAEATTGEQFSASAMC
jgi:cytochrome c oxidase subunit 6a